MRKQGRFEGQRARTVVGASVVGVALAAAGVLGGGVGFAKNSPTAAQYQYGKITICHKTRSIKHPSVMITISLNAWPAHQRHGDTLGACGTTPTTSTTTSTTASTTTTTTSSAVSTGPGHSGDHGNPHGNGHGNGNGQGHG